MNPHFQHIIIDAVYRSKNSKKDDKPYSNYVIAKAFLKFKLIMVREFKYALLIALGILSAAFGLKGFLLPSGFIDGGITGVSLLIFKMSNVSISLLIPLLNIPFIYLGYKQIGKMFVLKTTGAILLLSVCLAFIEFPIITQDKLLVSVFGGFFLGAGIGLAIRGGGVLDGTEIMAIYLGKKVSITIGDVILVLNIIIFSFAAWLLSLEVALYSILTYLAASKTVDFILEGIDEYTGVTIISARSEEMRKMIVDELGRGVTIYKGASGYGKRGQSLGELDIVYTVITRLEVARLKTEIEKIDSSAFVITNSINEIKGGMIKKRALVK